MIHPFDSLTDALMAFSAGDPIVVVDDELRENEGDIIFSAAQSTPDKINFCVREGRGLVCVAIGESIGNRLGLSKVRSNHKDPLSTAFLDSIDAVHSFGTTTGISASDRSITARLVADPNSKPNDFSTPGHLFPLQAVKGGLLKRRGHTEAAVDLCKLTGQPEAAIICEILDTDGTMLRREGLRKFADAHRLRMISIEQIVAHLSLLSCSCELVSQASLPTLFGKFEVRIYKNPVAGLEHVLLSIQDKPSEIPLLRIHSECHTGDIFGSLRCDCGEQLQTALRQIADSGHGHLIYLRGQEGRGIGLGNKIAAYRLQENGMDTYQANEQLGYPADARHYADAICIIKALQMDRFCLLTNNPEKISSLREAGFDFMVNPLQTTVNPFNHQYLSDKMKIGKHDLNILQ